MSKVEVKVNFETITPLWTGDAWMENSVIRPSSLMGSLRFWFEVICYFGDVCSKSEFDKDKGRFEKDIKNDEIRKKLLTNGTNFNGQIQALRELGVPVPAIVFGTTGWRSLIEIRGIQPLEDYCFGNKLNLPGKFCIKKDNFEIKEGGECPNPEDSRNQWSFFFFKIPYFWGKFEVVFKVEQNIKDNIFLPLLTFMDKYGYWGGGWNVGYGRSRVVKVDCKNNSWHKEEFDFSNVGIPDKKLKTYCNDNKINDCIVKTGNKNELTNEKLKNIIFCDIDGNQKIQDLIKNLIKEKSFLRRSISDKTNKIFGSIKQPTEDLPQGSKILPYINKLENDNYECGLLSIAGILSLYK